MVENSPPTTSAQGPSRSRPPREADPGWWYLRLLFRPGRYLRDALREVHPIAIVAASALVGMAAAVNRLEKSIAKGALTGRSVAVLSDVVQTWAGYWAWVALLGGIGAGVSYYFLGGWWFHRRLRWSMAGDSDVSLARRAYVMCGLVDSVPLLIAMSWRTLVFSDPTTAQSESTLWWNVVLIFPFWAAFVSYRAASAVFGARSWRAVALFWLLPWALYAFGLLAFVIAAIGALGSTPT